MPRRPVALLLALLTLPAQAAEIPPGYQAVAREYGLPPAALYAVALTESGKRLSSGRVRPWPWTLNVAGEPKFYATRAEAFRALRISFAQGITRIDVGLMQVSWRHHQALLRDAWTALDPYYNLRLGAWLLISQWHQSGNLWEAVGRYHAPAAPERAAAYRQRVGRWLERLCEPGEGHAQHLTAKGETSPWPGHPIRTASRTPRIPSGLAQALSPTVHGASRAVAGL